MYEKPFGTSGENFRELDQVVHSALDEQQVYRIDHFLGKEATQDLHLLRFANGSSAAYWDRGLTTARTMVEFFQRDVLVKTHPRLPCGA